MAKPIMDPNTDAPSPPVNTQRRPQPSAIYHPSKTLVIVGMMGAGKSSVGRKLAARLALPFVDADAEIETAAGCSIEEIFDRFGEAEFRKGERRVIHRLLSGSPAVLATGGGAFMDVETRTLIKEKGISIWLKANIELLLARTARKNNRPLLKKGDPRQTLERLLTEREPLYAEADVTVISDERPTDDTVDLVLSALNEFETVRQTRATG